MLPASVRQTVRRSADLAEENKQLYEKIHQLLTEITGLRVVRSQYESLLESLASTPTRALQDTLHRQDRRVVHLQSQLSATQSELDAALEQCSELKCELDRRANEPEKSAQLESDAGRTCGAIAKSLQKLISTCNSSESPSSLETLHENVRAAADVCVAAVKERRQLEEAAQTKRDEVSEIEAKIRVLDDEKNVTDQRNARYDRERNELGGTIAKLRTELASVKARLVAAEDEKKRLKAENAKLRAAIAPLKH
jgi:chromosome segregation ATPase